MDSDTGVDSYLFDSKPSSGPSARIKKTSGLQASRQLNPGIYKVVKGSGLTKKERREIEGSVFEDLQSNVFYSMKKQKRWQSVNDAENVLQSAALACPLVAVGAVEKYGGKHCDDHDSLHVFGRLEAGTGDVQMVKTRSGKGTNLRSLEDSLDFKTGKKVPGNEPHKPELTIVITRQCEEQRVKVGGSKNRQKKRFNHLKECTEDDACVHTSSDSDHDYIEQFEEAADDQVEDRKNMKLTDFVVTKTPVQRTKRVSNRYEPAAEELVDNCSDTEPVYSSEQYENYLYKRELLKGASFREISVDLKSSKLRTEGFFERLGQWIAKHPLLTVDWINEEQCLLDLSKWFHPHNLVAVVGFHVVHRRHHRGLIKIIINTTIPCSFSHQDLAPFETRTPKNAALYEHLLMDRLVASLKGGALYPAPKTHTEATGLGKLMYNVAVDCTVVRSWNDYELIQKWADSASPSGRATSSSDNSFEVIKLNVCEYCGDEDPDKLLKLNCVHVFCEKCAKFAFTEQILSHSSPLTCPSCDTAPNIVHLLMLLPIPLIRSALRDSLDSSGESAGTGDCPDCGNVYQQSSGKKNYKCFSCKVAFCQECKLATHFPLSCSQMKKWVDFDDSSSPVQVKDADIDPCQLCQCDEFESGAVSRGYDRLRCPECNLIYYHYFGNIASDSKRPEEEDDADVAMGKKLGSRYINVRDDILDDEICYRLQWHCYPVFRTDLKWELVRRKALEALHFGFIWLQLERRQKHSDEWKAANSALNQLKSLYDKFKAEILLQNHSFFQGIRHKIEKHVAAMFCEECEFAPHFPVPCSRAKEFLVSHPSPGPSSKFQRQISYKCYCSFVFPGGCKYEQCQSCHLYYKTWNNLMTWNNWDGRAVALKGVEMNPKPDDSDSKQYGSEYNDLRNELVDSKALKLLQLRVKSFLNSHEIEQVMNIRARALQLLLFGHIWLNLEKKAKKTGQWKIVSSALNQLRVFFDLFICDLIHQNQRFYDVRQIKLNKKINATASLFSSTAAVDESDHQEF